MTTPYTTHAAIRRQQRGICEEDIAQALADERARSRRYYSHIVWYSPAVRLLLVLSHWPGKLITVYRPKPKQIKQGKWRCTGEANGVYW